MLTISMGIELGKVHGKDNVAIITNDKRLALIANACSSLDAPKAFYMKDTKVEDLQTFQSTPEVVNALPTHQATTIRRRRPPPHGKIDSI